MDALGALSVQIISNARQLPELKVSSFQLETKKSRLVLTGSETTKLAQGSQMQTFVISILINYDLGENTLVFKKLSNTCYSFFIIAVT